MIEIDWRGIARSAKGMGGEGSNLLLFKSKAKDKPGVSTLDSVTPPDDGEGPANGSWFETPQGPMLFIEGMDSDVNPWIEQLVAALVTADLDGVITGGRTVNETRIAWAEPFHRGGYPSLSGLLGYRPVPNYLQLDSGWRCGPELLESAVSHAVDWMCAQGGTILANVDLRADFWVDRAAAVQILAQQSSKDLSAVSRVYNEERRELRTVKKGRYGQFALTFTGQRADWREVIGELRTNLLASSVDGLSIAMISHLDWTNLLYSGDQFFDRAGYKWYPNRWDEFTLDPCGIQILTAKQLEKANDLSA